MYFFVSSCELKGLSNYSEQATYASSQFQKLLRKEYFSPSPNLKVATSIGIVRDVSIVILWMEECKSIAQTSVITHWLGGN